MTLMAEPLTGAQGKILEPYSISVAVQIRSRTESIKPKKTRKQHLRVMTIFNTPLKRAFYCAQLKIKNKTTEIHPKLALWLCENYRVILLPEYETSKMSKKMERRISKRSVRMMCRWRHFSFQQALIFLKAKLFPWCKLVLCQESYTSKTCNECGTLHHK